MLLLHARISEYRRSDDCWDNVRRRRVSRHETLSDRPAWEMAVDTMRHYDPAVRRFDAEAPSDRESTRRLERRCLRCSDRTKFQSVLAEMPPSKTVQLALKRQYPSVFL